MKHLTNREEITKELNNFFSTIGQEITDYIIKNCAKKNCLKELQIPFKSLNLSLLLKHYYSKVPTILGLYVSQTC